MSSPNLAKHPGTVLSLILCSLSLGIASAAPPRREAKVDLDSAHRSAGELRSVLVRAAKDAGGDLEQQHLHLVLGFSTGHYSSDPLSAEAARHIASSLVTDFLVPDDRLSAYAFEMDLWDHPQAHRNGEPVPADKSKVLDLWPLTPQSGSPGGHDTERAITRIVDKVGNAGDAVIVLLTNTAASISVPGQRVIGANSPEYQAILNRWQRLPQVNKSGASAVLPFTVINPDGSSVPRSLDAVVLLPKKFSGSGLSATRASLLQTVPENKLPSGGLVVPPASFDSRWLIVPFALAGVVALIIWLIGAKPRALVLQVEGTSFDLSDTPDGEEICHIAGPGYPEANTRTVLVTQAGAPPARIGRFIKERGAAVLVRGDAMQLLAVGGAQVSGSKLLKGDGRFQLQFRGNFQRSPVHPSEVVDLTVRASMGRTESGKVA